MVNLYSIKDSRGDFSPVICFANDEIAKRNIPFLIEGNMLYERYPEDFSLFAVGLFDTDSGVIVPDTSPRFVCDFPAKEVSHDV